MPWWVFPTPVGMNLAFLISAWYRTRVPHARGDEPEIKMADYIDD